jgi:hypothetical protein
MTDPQRLPATSKASGPLQEPNRPTESTTPFIEVDQFSFPMVRDRCCSM